MIKRMCVYCGSHNGARERYVLAAQQVGEGIARRGLELVYGGGRVGLMGAVADAALAAGGRVIGVMPQALVDREIAHLGLTELHVVKTMHERKAMMADLSDAFVTLPGGFGTLDEICEMITWAQLGYHQKALSVLNVEGYFDGLLAFFDHAAQEHFIRPKHRDLLVVETDVDALLDHLLVYRPPYVDKWRQPDER